MSKTTSLFLSSKNFPKRATLFPFFLEEYWLFYAVDHIARLLPKADWTGLFDSFSEWGAVEFTTEPKSSFSFSKKSGGDLEASFKIRNYPEALFLADQIRQEYKPSKLIVSPTHIVTRLSYDHYVQEYPDLTILSLDAHDDSGGEAFPDNLWITGDIGARTILIGGREEKSLRFQEQTPYLGVFEDIEAAMESQQFREACQSQNVLLSIDLDYFQRYQWGFPTYLARELFIGHSMNITQIIESLLAKNPLDANETVVIGEVLDLFHSSDSLETFRQKRLAAIEREGATARDKIGRIIEFLEDIRSNIISIDLCEFCAPLDYEGAGTRILRDLCENLLRKL
ncbi:MAG: hypothetical protein ACE5OZ_00130 [Candidatus Heimdallarchaeota archaeon]